MKKILIILSLLLTELNISAHDFEVDNLYYYITSLTDRTVTVVGGTDSDGHVVIPQNVTWNGITFTVNAADFSNYTFFSLTVPPTVLYMYLFDTTISKLVIEDGEEPLYTSPDMGPDDFASGSNIGELYLGRNTPCNFAFCNIKKVTFGNNVTEIAPYMFRSCAIKGTIILSKNIKKIGSSAFSDNVILEKVIAPGIEYIESAAFYSCYNLKTIETPNLKYIGTNAFHNCRSLTSFEIPQGVFSVHKEAFSDCTNLESVIIPNSIYCFGNKNEEENGGIFTGCTALKSITVNALTPFELVESNFDVTTYFNATLHVPSESLDIYKNTPVWKNFVNIVGDASSEDNVCYICIKYIDYGSNSVEIDNEKYEFSYNNDILIKKIRGESITLKFIPFSEYYKLETVKINGKDVTDKIVDNELTIEVTENLTIDASWSYVDESAIDDIHSNSSSAKVVGSSGNIMISNAEDGETVYVYTIAGILVNTSVINGSTATIRVHENEVYIVKVGNKTFKIGM